MNSKLFKIFAVAIITTLFIGSQAFACPGAGRDKDTSAYQSDQGKSLDSDKDINNQSQFNDQNWNAEQQDTDRSQNMDQPTQNDMNQ